ncbi:stage 0 sporulation family protein [Planctomycetota bacterium]
MAYVVTARFGFMRNLAQFVTDDPSCKRSEWVVLRTERGTELGDVMVQSRKPGSEDTMGELGRVLRKATPKDLERGRVIDAEKSVHEYAVCKSLVRDLGLAMRLVSVEHLFGGEKLIFYFTAEGRIDFRELVRQLARTFRTRIEMRQIGARDEARLLGSVGHCGRRLCCRTFLRELEPVTMRMARSQKATLDPSKISGACGRLMCCLRYEDQTYRDIRRDLPQLGAVYRFAKGPAEVIGHEILARRVLMELEGGERHTVGAEELTEDMFLERRDPRRKQRSAASESAGAAPTTGERRARRKSGRTRERRQRRDGSPASDAGTERNREEEESSS